MPAKETVIRNEIVRVKGKVKAITVPKEKTQEILRRVELRVLDKKYEVLMPPPDGMEKNNIDLQGMATFIQEYLSILFQSSSPYSTNNYAQIVITTNTGGKILLNYGNTVVNNAQGVTTAIQVFGQQNAMTIQYYYIGYDTTDSSYQGNYLELYATAWAYNASGSSCSPPCSSPCSCAYTTNLIRIAFANLSINKQSNYDLFILWLIEFQNIPQYLLIFIPQIPATPGLIPETFKLGTMTAGSGFNVYVNNGNCNFACGGNCPTNLSIGAFMLSIQNNTIVLQIPLMIPISGGASQAQVLICGNFIYNNSAVIQGSGIYVGQATYTFSPSYSTTIAPPSSGYTFYALLTVIAITFTVS